MKNIVYLMKHKSKSEKYQAIHNPTEFKISIKLRYLQVLSKPFNDLPRDYIFKRYNSPKTIWDQSYFHIFKYKGELHYWSSNLSSRLKSIVQDKPFLHFKLHIYLFSFGRYPKNTRLLHITSMYCVVHRWGMMIFVYTRLADPPVHRHW